MKIEQSELFETFATMAANEGGVQSWEHFWKLKNARKWDDVELIETLIGMVHGLTSMFATVTRQDPRKVFYDMARAAKRIGE